MNPQPSEGQPEQDAPTAPTEETVEAVVRRQLSKALGGIRGILEAAVPTIMFTVTFLLTRDIRTALYISVAGVLVLLVARIIQRSTIQFVFNSLVGIGVGAAFAWNSARSGGDSGDQALAYFLPGLLYNSVYAVVLILSVVVGWPLVGFLVGSVTGDPTAWHRDHQIVRLCRNLTWMLVLPCVLRVLVQGPIYLSGKQGLADKDVMVGLLGASKLAMGWPLQVAALAAMIYLLGRNRIPVRSSPTTEA